MTPLQHIDLHTNEFTKIELKIKDYVINHLEDISLYPINQIADEIKTSKSALMRFCQKCGYRGYSEFKYEISRYLQSSIQTEHSSSHIKEYLENYTKKINELAGLISSDKLDMLSQYIMKARFIKIYGIHETGLATKYFGYRLTNLGINSEVITETSVLPEKASLSKQDDLNIFISLSAQTTIIKDALLYADMNNATNILITQNDHHGLSSKITLDFIISSFDKIEPNSFVDSQALLFITIDLIINNLAYHLKEAR